MNSVIAPVYSRKGELLAAVERLGSLRQAAVESGRSYRQVWGDINKAEKYLGFKLVHRSRGGSGGVSDEKTRLWLVMNDEL